MKIKELRVSKSGVIPIASYSNLRPGFEIVAEVGEEEDLEKCKLTLKRLSPIFEGLQNVIDEQFEREEQSAAIKRIEKLYKNIRFYKKGGKKYPSVTSVMDWDTEWKIPSYELNQFASRGKIIHKICELYLTDNKWYEPTKVPELAADVNIVLSGNLGLHWENCSHKKFLEKYKDDIKIEAIEEPVFNDGLLYAGTPDIRGGFKGKKGPMDFKTGSFNMAQLAAYAACEKGNEQLVVFPVGPTNNVSGYNRPVICEGECKELNFKKFLVLRKKFRENFGI